MDNFPIIYQKWRQRLYNVAFLIACFTLILEIIISYLMIKYLPEMIAAPLPEYIVLYIIIPRQAIFFGYTGRSKDISKKYRKSKELYLRIRYNLSDIYYCLCT